MKNGMHDFKKMIKETFTVGYILDHEESRYIDEIKKRMVVRNYGMILPIAGVLFLITAFLLVSDLLSGFHAKYYPYSILNLAAEITHLAAVLVVAVNLLDKREKSRKVMHTYTAVFLFLCSVGCSLYLLSDTLRQVVSSTPYLAVSILVIAPILFEKEFLLYYGIYLVPMILCYILTGYADALNVVLHLGGYVLHRFLLAGYVRERLVNIKYEESHDELLKMNRTDFLTKIGNRKMLYETIEKNRTRWIAGKKEVCLIMMDIDHFKCYNDTFSHLQGDNCLVSVSFAIKQALEKHQMAESTFIRFGGEEFLIMLVGEQLEQELHDIYADIRQNLELLAIPSGKGAAYPYVTISAGAEITTYTEELVIEDLMRQADGQLYLAKEQGRNALGFRGKSERCQSRK